MVDNKKHPFHKIIGDIFDSLKIPGAELRKDSACRRDYVEIDIDMINDKEKGEKIGNPYRFSYPRKNLGQISSLKSIY